MDWQDVAREHGWVYGILSPVFTVRTIKAQAEEIVALRLEIKKLKAELMIRESEPARNS